MPPVNEMCIRDRIGAAEKLKLICTTLDGLAKIRENENRYVN